MDRAPSPQSSRSRSSPQALVLGRYKGDAEDDEEEEEKVTERNIYYNSCKYIYKTHLTAKPKPKKKYNTELFFIPFFPSRLETSIWID